jgi:hypothetical protein
MAKRFGSFLGDGDAGNSFRCEEIEPLLDREEEIVFDFGGVENLTDSFCNACFANLAAERPDTVKSNVRFINCSPVVQAFLSSALNLARIRLKQTPTR